MTDDIQRLSVRVIRARSAEQGTKTPWEEGTPAGVIERAVAISDPVALRPAARDDCERIWAWNFAADVRARSKRAETVAFITHERWFARRLADGVAPIWVVEEHGAPLGVVRLDPTPHGRTRISIALAASARGRGIGQAAIAAACRSWRRPIVAEIFDDNLASRTCFAACGFRAVGTSDGLGTYHWDPET